MMFRIETKWAGYSRGTAIYEVDGDTEAEAMEDYEHGIISKSILSDHIKSEIVSVEDIT